ncbi:MAG: methyltransferase domain-containing protein [Marinovum algicola]|jgi:phosphatidylethanolamine/phosphatidyl-N-methylethanolamine N-methyltransferase|uniref:class I SAM-dependent methyltransferase n=1 Tax=Marinovum algicola TaxID=42444 RepID=UPI0032EF1932
MSNSDFALFMGQLLKKPHQVVALAPSSRFLCAEMVAGLDPDGGPVIELGAGTGNITRAILGAGIAPENCHSIEMNPEFCDRLRARFPRLNVHHMSAGDIGHLPVDNAQAVISGLPLLSMPTELQRAILTGFTRRVTPGGSYVQFTYGPKPPVARAVRDELGLEWRRSGKIWWNMPPARVYRFSQPVSVPA